VSEDRAVFEAALAAQQDGRPAALAIVVETQGSVPRQAGSKMLVWPDGQIVGTVGGGQVEAFVIAEAQTAMRSGQSRIVSYDLADPQSGDPGVCGGSVRVYVEPLLPPATVLVIGVGHVGKAVAELAKWLGYRVVVSDDRPDYATPEQIPGMDGYLTVAPGDLVEQAPITARTYLVVVTRGLIVDEALLPALLRTDAPYIGLIGSRRRWMLTAEALRAGHSEPYWHALTRPGWGEVEAALRGAAISAQAEAPLYLVHMNVAGEVDMLAYARENGLQVMGETCPQYLFFTEDDLRRPDGAKWICSPPMRSRLDNERLWQGLQDGTIQAVATDHCPFYYDGSRPIVYEGREIAIPGKELGRENFTLIPNGLPGVGDRLPVLWTHGVVGGRMTPNQFVALNCTNPARIFGLYPRKGTLVPGADADVVIWNPASTIDYGVEHARHRTDYNLYEGWELNGYPERVFLRGKLIVDHETWLGAPGQGQFIPRKPFADVI